jgi:hypothetical protein
MTVQHVPDLHRPQYEAITHLHLVPILRVSGVLPPRLQGKVSACLMSDTPRICEYTATELRHCSEYPEGLHFVSTCVLGQVSSKSELKGTTFLKT